MFVTEAFAGEAATAPAAEANAHTSEPAGEHAGVFPPFDSSNYPSQILWLALTFVFFYMFLKRVIIPRVGNILTTRESRISSDLKAAEKMKEEADAAVSAYEQELAAAKAKSAEIASRAANVSKAETAANRKAAEAALDKKMSEAEGKIAAVKAAGMKDVGKIAEETVIAIIKQLTGTSASSTDAAAAVKAVRG